MYTYTYVFTGIISVFNLKTNVQNLLEVVIQQFSKTQEIKYGTFYF